MQLQSLSFTCAHINIIMDINKNMAMLKNLESFVPILLSLLPENFRNKHICSIIYESLKSFNSPEWKSICEQLVYDNQHEPSSPFYTIFGICEYLDNLAKSDQNDKNNIMEVRQLNTILSLPANVIIEKNITFKLANLNVSESIKRALQNGYTYETCDKALQYTHTIIFKLLSLKVSEISISELSKIAKQL